MAVEAPAEIALVNGRVLTLDVDDRVAQALAIRDGRITAVGDDSSIRRLVDSTTEVIDLAGRTAMPGLADCHVHLASDAAKSEEVEARDFYSDVRSVGDILERLRAASQEVPPGTWIVGRGCPMQNYRLSERRLPTRAELDATLPAHPAYITFGAHVLVANSQALTERKVTQDTPSPQGGVVVKDERTGEPTGVLLERAQFLLKPKATGTEPEMLAEAISIELERCLSRGVTTIHDIIVSPKEVQAYQLLRRKGKLPLRVQMLIRVIESGFRRESLKDLGILHGFGDDFLKIGGIKMSIDGGFTGKNAAFSEKLEDEPCNRGLIRINQDELDETVAMYHQAGMRICVHAMGDVALDMILDSYAKAVQQHPRPELRHRIEHMGNWMCAGDRMRKAKELGIVPVANPSFLYFLTSEIKTVLGQVRTEDAFPFRTMVDEGFPLVFGSDAPGYWPIDPLRDLGAAATHTAYEGSTICQEQRVSIAQALRSQTRNAAWLGFEERRLGTLEPGKLADVAVLNDDPFTFPADHFRELPVDCTIVNGEIAYRRVAHGN